MRNSPKKTFKNNEMEFDNKNLNYSNTQIKIQLKALATDQNEHKNEHLCLKTDPVKYSNQTNRNPKSKIKIRKTAFKTFVTTLNDQILDIQVTLRHKGGVNMENMCNDIKPDHSSGESSRNEIQRTHRTQ